MTDPGTHIGRAALELIRPAVPHPDPVTAVHRKVAAMRRRRAAGALAVVAAVAVPTAIAATALTERDADRIVPAEAPGNVVLPVSELAGDAPGPLQADPSQPVTRRTGSGRPDQFNLLTYTSASGDDCIGWQRGGRTSNNTCGDLAGKDFVGVGQLSGPRDDSIGLRLFAGWAPPGSESLRVTGPDVNRTFELADPPDERGRRYFAVTVRELDPDVVLEAVDGSGRVLANRPYTGLITRAAEADEAEQQARQLAGHTPTPGRLGQGTGRGPGEVYYRRQAIRPDLAVTVDCDGPAGAAVTVIVGSQTLTHPCNRAAATRTVGQPQFPPFNLVSVQAGPGTAWTVRIDAAPTR